MSDDTSLHYDNTTAGEVIRWLCRKCRTLALDGDFEQSKSAAEECFQFESTVTKFHRENPHVGTDLNGGLKKEKADESTDNEKAK